MKRDEDAGAPHRRDGVKPDTRPVRRQRLRFVGYVFAACALATGVALLTGVPQRMLLEGALHRVLGARAEISRPTLFGHIRSPEIRLFDDDAPKPQARPTVAVRGLDLDYALLGHTSRRVPYLGIESLDVFLDGTDPAHPNYTFLNDLLFGPPSGIDPILIIPKIAALDHLSAELRLPDASVRLDGLQLKARVDALDAFSISLTATPASGWCRVPSKGLDRSFAGAEIRAIVQRHPDELLLEALQVALQGIVQIAAQGRAQFTGDGVLIDADVEQCIVLGDEIPDGLWAMAPMPVHFRECDLSGTSFHGVFTGEAIEAQEARLALRIATLTAGPTYHELYQGDLEVAGVSPTPHGPGWDIEATLQDGQAVRGFWSGGVRQGSASVALTDWTRQDVLDALPSDVRAVLDVRTTFQGLSSAFDLAWQGKDYTVSGTLDPRVASPGGAVETMAVALAGHGSAASPTRPLFDGSLSASLDGQAVSADIVLALPDRLDATVVFDHLDPRRWLLTLAGSYALDLLHAELGGKATLQKDDIQGGWQCTADLAAAELGISDWRLPEGDTLSISGDGTLDEALEEVSSRALTLAVGETASLTIDELRATLRPLQADGRLHGNFDLAYVAKLASLPGLWGELEFDAPFRHSRGVLEADLRTEARMLGYGDLAAPYGTPVTASGHVRYDTLARAGTAADAVIAVGDGTRLTLAACSFTRIPFAGDGDIALETDLAAFIAMGWLDAAAGKATATGHVGYAAGRPLLTDLKLDAEADSLTLANALGVLSDTSLDGQFAYDGGLKGTGALTAREAVVGGATIAALSAPITAEHYALRAEGLTFDIFGGKVKADVSFGLLQEGFPLTANAEIEGVDLATFSRDYEVPSVKLTGIARGHIEAAIKAGRIEALKVDIESSKDFTINRELVAELLLSEQVSGLKGGRALGRAVNRVLGDAEQRPFDRATLQMGLSEGRLSGQALLQSEDLSLTIDLKVDSGALLEALRLRQEMHVAELETR